MEEYHFDSDSLIEIPYDGTQDTIKINNPGKGPAKHYSADFIDAYMTFFKKCIEGGRTECFINMHLEALDAMNVIYLDIDVYYPADETAPEKNDEANARLYRDIFVKAGSLTPANTHIYIPTTYEIDNGLQKGGAHIFIYLDKNVDKTSRNKMYNTARDFILKDEHTLTAFKEHGLDITASNYDKIFDPQPLMGCKCLLPLCVKLNAKRTYRLVDVESIDLDNSTLVLPNKHAESKVADEEEIEVEDEDVEIDSNCVPTYSCTYKETLKFIRNLRYLSPRHPLWAKISAHNSRPDVFKPVFHWLVLCIFTEDPSAVSEALPSKVKNELARVLFPLLRMTNKPGEANTLKDLIQYIKGYIDKPYGDPTKTKYDPKEHPYHIFCEQELSGCCKFILDKPDSMITGGVAAYVAIHHKNLDKDDRANYIHELSREMLRARRYAGNIISNYVEFVSSIAENLSDEIRPFGLPIDDEDILSKDYRVNMNKRVVMPDEVRPGVPISFDELRALRLNKPIKRKSVSTKYYDKFMSRMFRMFLACYFYQLSANSFSAIRKSISAFIAYFVYTKKDGTNPMPRLYNIRQTVELCKYPYNQWLPPDEHATQLIDWFSEINEVYVERELNTSRKRKFICSFIQMQRIFQTSPSISKTTDIKNESKLYKTLKSLSRDVMVVNYKRENEPVEWDPTLRCPYHPMRNGILKFIVPEYPTDGLNWREYCEFSYDNYDIIINGTSNVYFDENYGFDRNPAYQRVSRMFKEIQTRKEMHDFELQCCSSVLHSIGQRDQIHQYYGTGSEGKTLWNNAIMFMLGESSLPIAIQKTVIGDYYPEGMSDPVMVNPLPLATTIEAKAVMRPNTNSHDSGGIIELKSKRFCSIAEIDVATYGRNLQVAVCKQITGENPIRSRQIREKSESLIPRLYLTLQTNSVLGYSENNAAIDRRFAVIEHTSKFMTRALADIDHRKGRMRQFEADTSLGSKIQTDPAYWQAVFYVLLPYARKYIGRWYDSDEDAEALNVYERTGGHAPYSAISDVPKPERVKCMTRISISCSSGLVGWIDKHLVKEENSLITLKRIIDKVLQEDKNSEMSKDGGVLDVKYRRMPEESKRLEVTRQLTSQFGGAWLFKLRDEFWNDDDTLRDEITIQPGAYEVIDRDKLDEAGEKAMYENPPRKIVELKAPLILRRSSLHLQLSDEEKAEIQTDIDSDAMIDFIFQDGMSISDVGGIRNLDGVYVIDHKLKTKSYKDDEN